MNYLLVFIGGGLGCVLRYLLGILMANFQINLPISTLLSNILASLIFAIGLKLTLTNFYTDSLKCLVLIGFCGGLSTFSSFSYETFLLLKTNFNWGILNIVLNFVICIGIFFILIKQNATN